MKKVILIVATVIMSAQISLAQVQGQSAASSELIGFRRGLATVMLAGLGGAILGLSTLSFYGDPQEHISNIWTGLAVGAIGGGLYVVSQSRANSSLAQASEPRQIPFGKKPGSPLAMQFAWDF